MSGRFLAPNDKVQFHGRYWVVAGVNNAGDTVFQSSDNGQYTTMTEVEIKTAYTSGELKPIAGGKTPQETGDGHPGYFSQASGRVSTSARLSASRTGPHIESHTERA